MPKVQVVTFCKKITLVFSQKIRMPSKTSKNGNVFRQK